MMSSTVHSSGMLMVFEMAPEMNGCTAAIMLARGPCSGWSACRSRAEAAIEDRQMLVLQCGAPSMVPVASMWLTMAFDLLAV